jgi:hypothetical protein
LVSTRLTLARCFRLVPGLGICEITRPFPIFREAFRLTLPTVQCRSSRRRLAASSVLPITLGTRQAGRRLNFAMTVCSPMPVLTLQLRVPKQPPPDQPSNRVPARGVAVSVSVLPESKEARQVGPQWIPAGELETTPRPLPTLVTARLTRAGEPPVSRPWRLSPSSYQPPALQSPAGAHETASRIPFGVPAAFAGGCTSKADQLPLVSFSRKPSYTFGTMP